MLQNNPKKTFLTYEFWLLLLVPVFCYGLFWLLTFFYILNLYSLPSNYLIVATYVPFLLSQFYFITNIINILNFKETHFGFRFLFLVIHVIIFISIAYISFNAILPLIILQIVYLIYTLLNIFKSEDN